MIHEKEALYVFECLDVNLSHFLTLSIPACCFDLSNSEKWNNKMNTQYLSARLCVHVLCMHQNL